MTNTPAFDRAKAAHCRPTKITGKQCLVCWYSKTIRNRPSHVVCTRLHMEIPNDHTCDEYKWCKRIMEE